jgi:hypothetical protein
MIEELAATISRYPTLAVFCIVVGLLLTLGIVGDAIVGLGARGDRSKRP